MLTLPAPPASVLFMDGKRAQKWAGLYKGVVGMAGLDNPTMLAGVPTMDNSSSLPPLLRFLHPDCKAYAAK
jgi:hypothetical protein